MDVSGVTHLGFSDESHHNFGRFRGIGLVTVERTHVERLNRDLQVLFELSGIRELKWQKVRTARDRLAMRKIVQLVLRSPIRVDVLTWDTHDARHAVVGRSDRENLQRMYYRLLSTTLSKRWPSEATWLLHPDENSEMRWDDLSDVLHARGQQARTTPSTSPLPRLSPGRDFRILSVAPRRSLDEPLIQVADAFVGMSIYTRTSYDQIHAARTQGQLGLFEDSSSVSFTSSDRERCAVVSELVERCKVARLGVSLRRDHGLKTHSPEHPINFWPYERQSEHDTAPVRSRPR